MAWLVCLGLQANVGTEMELEEGRGDTVESAAQTRIFRGFAKGRRHPSKAPAKKALGEDQRTFYAPFSLKGLATTAI